MTTQLIYLGLFALNFYIAWRLYNNYLPSCTAAKETIPWYTQLLLAVGALLWLPLTVILIAILFGVIVYAVVTDGDRLVSLTTLKKRK